MRKTTLLKTFLMLCAFVVGGSVWAQSDYSTTYTSGNDLTLPNTGKGHVIISDVEYDAYKLGTGSVPGTINITVPSGTKYLHLHAAGWNKESVTLTMKKGSDNLSTINLTSDTGISGNGSTFTIADANKCSTDYYKVVTFSNALSQETQFTFTATSGNRFVVWGVNAEKASTFTITAESNNDDYGTVSLLGSTITANPATGYRVSTTNPYTVSPEGSATVSQSGNTFTVTPSANTTVTINFEAIPTHTVMFSVNGATSTQDFAEGAAITFPADPADIYGKSFVGWTTSSIDGTQATAPTFVNSATMDTNDETYYAVFAAGTQTPLTFVGYEKVTTAPNDWSGTYLLGATYNGGNDDSKKGTFVFESFGENIGNRVALVPGTTECPNYEIVIEKSGDYYTLYHVNSQKYFSYSGSSNSLLNNTSVESNNEKWSISSSGVISNAGSTARKIQYNGSSPRFACYTSNQTATDLYKRIEEGGTMQYSDYCTTVPVPAITLNANSVAATAAGADGTVNVTYTAIDLSDTPAVEWYTDATATATTDAPNWIETEIDSDNNLFYVIGANDGAARTAYLKIFAIDVNGEDFVYSDLITVTQAAATVTATVGAKGFATFVSDKALDFTGKSIKAYTINSTDGSALTLTQKDQVAANEPVLLYSETASDSQDIPVIASATADNSNELRAGTGAAITWSETNPVYVLNTTNTPAFYRANNSPVATNKAYLDLTGVNPSRSFFTLSLDGEVQGISDVNRETMTNRYFDMQGRRVAQPTKGMYIVNGKKVVVK